MSTASVCFALVVTMSAGLAVCEEPDPHAILGEWELRNDKMDVRVTIEPDGDLFAGRISWLEKPCFDDDDAFGMGGLSRVDRNNPDPELRERPLLGLQVMHGLHFDAPDRWDDGRIYAPDNGKTYCCQARIREDGTLDVRAYVKFLFAKFGRTIRLYPVPSATNFKIVESNKEASAPDTDM